MFFFDRKQEVRETGLLAGSVMIVCLNQSRSPRRTFLMGRIIILSFHSMDTQNVDPMEICSEVNTISNNFSNNLSKRKTSTLERSTLKKSRRDSHEFSSTPLSPSGRPIFYGFQQIYDVYQNYAEMNEILKKIHAEKLLRRESSMSQDVDEVEPMDLTG